MADMVATVLVHIEKLRNEALDDRPLVDRIRNPTEFHILTGRLEALRDLEHFIERRLHEQR